MADTQETVETQNQEPLKMLNPFGDMQQVPQFQKARPRWINVSGDGKLGKTFTMIELAKYIETLYFDTDPLLSTAAYDGFFIRCANWIEADLAFNKYKNLCKARGVVTKPKIVVIDVLDGLSDYCKAHVIKMAGTDDLLKAEIKMADGSSGNGYTLLHSLMKNKISEAQEMGELLITVCHPRISALGKDEKVKQVKTLNLVGAFKSFVQQSCDANLWFVKKVDARGREFVAIQGDPGDDVSVGEGFGIRPFQGLRDADTAEKFIQWVVDTYK